MIRRTFAWMCMLLLVVLAGCNSLQRDAEVSREQWEPETDSAATAAR